MSQGTHRRISAMAGAALLLSVSAGCMDLLPAGEPPSGDIVKNDPLPSAPETPRARENRLATGLIACALNRCPGSAWALQSGPGNREQGLRLMQSVSETAGVRIVPEGSPGCYTLCGKEEKDGIVWSLVSPAGENVWQGR